MRKYFLQIRFQSNFGNKFWFPLFIEALNTENANLTMQNVINALNDNKKD